DRYRPQAVAATNDSAFAQVLAGMLDQLHDVHVTLTPFGDGSTMRYLSPYDTLTTWFWAPRIAQTYLSSFAATSGGHVRYGSAGDGVWYFYIPSFVGDGWSGEIDDALARASGASAIIIDIRHNGGGN